MFFRNRTLTSTLTSTLMSKRPTSTFNYNFNNINNFNKINNFNNIKLKTNSQYTISTNRNTNTHTQLMRTRGYRRYNKIDTIETLKRKIENDDNVEYLKKNNVLEWLFGDPKFISKLTKKAEDAWGKNTIGYETNQWTTKLGESILKEILYLLDKNPSRVKVPQKGMNSKRLMPDFEADDGMYENKARTYTTSGTAGEKILGTPLKYCEIPRLYGKPLYIVCMAYQEIEADISFHLFDPLSEELVDILEHFEEKWMIKYIRATDLLIQIAKEE